MTSTNPKDPVGLKKTSVEYVITDTLPLKQHAVVKEPQRPSFEQHLSATRPPPSTLLASIDRPAQVIDKAQMDLTIVCAPMRDGRQPASRPQKSPETTCPYHGPIMNFILPSSNQELSPMGRYLAEGPIEQHIVGMAEGYVQLSIHKGCTCETVGSDLEISDDEEETGHKELDGQTQEAREAFWTFSKS